MIEKSLSAIIFIKTMTWRTALIEYFRYVCTFHKHLQSYQYVKGLW